MIKLIPTRLSYRLFYWSTSEEGKICVDCGKEIEDKELVVCCLCDGSLHFGCVMQTESFEEEEDQGGLVVINRPLCMYCV